MTSTIGSRRREGGIGMPTGIALILGTAGVVVTLWLAWLALTSDAVPIVGTARGALIAIAVVGMTACAVAGIGQAPLIGWTHPVTIIGIIAGVVALALVGAGLLGWDGLVRPAAGIVPVGATVAATTERLAIGLLAGLIAIKWVVGIVQAVLLLRQG
jgi:hypothetical protein